MCTTVKSPDGQVMAIVCGLRRRALPRCKFCGQGEATKLCDFPMGNGKTCDVPMCDGCAKVMGFDRDYCPAHAPQRPLFGGE
jgi:hypothetical protein